MTPSPPSPPFTPVRLCHLRALHAKVCTSSCSTEPGLTQSSHTPDRLVDTSRFTSFSNCPRPFFVEVCCCFSLSVGGVAKSQNSSQMNLSGSSSSLTSDASTKAGTISLRSYGIGGPVLHKRILLMTQQSSREVVEEADMTGLLPSGQMRGRCRQQSKQRAQTDAGPMTTFLLHPQQMTPKPPESHIRKRLMSPFRALRERSRSKKRMRKGSAAVIEEMSEVVSSLPQDQSHGQAGQRVRRLVSPNPFLCLCRGRHRRRKTV